MGGIAAHATVPELGVDHVELILAYDLCAGGLFIRHDGGADRLGAAILAINSELVVSGVVVHGGRGAQAGVVVGFHEALTEVFWPDWRLYCG